MTAKLPLTLLLTSLTALATCATPCSPRSAPGFLDALSQSRQRSRRGDARTGTGPARRPGPLNLQYDYRSAPPDIIEARVRASSATPGACLPCAPRSMPMSRPPMTRRAQRSPALLVHHCGRALPRRARTLPAGRDARRPHHHRNRQFAHRHRHPSRPTIGRTSSSHGTGVVISSATACAVPGRHARPKSLPSDSAACPATRSEDDVARRSFV